MSFPKHRDGFTPEGNSAANYLGTRGDVWERKRRGNAVGINKGGMLETRVDPMGLDGFYSVGQVEGQQRVVGSATARGRFTYRGTFVLEDGLAGVDQIRYYGRGLGQDSTAQLVGNTVDFDGKSLNVYDVQTYRTRDGRTFRPFYDFLAVAPFGYGTQLTYLPGAVYGSAGARAFQSGYTYMSVAPDGQHFHAFIRDNGTEQTLVAVRPIADQLAAHAACERLAPAAYLVMGAYHRPNYSGSSVDAAASPGLAFSFSSDAGATWQAATSNDLFAEFFDTVQTLPVPLYASTFNEAVNAAGLAAAPISARFAVAYVVVPYAPNPGVDFVLKAKVKVGLIDNATRTLAETAVLFDGDIVDAIAFWSGGCASVQGGAVLVTRPKSPDGTAHTPEEPPVFLFTPNGTDIVTTGTGPQPNYRTGLVTAISPTQIVLPMYDNAHSLFESRDRGATWAKRAIFAETAAAPVAAPGALTLEDFAVLTFLRRDDQPANATPGAPWISDSRIAAPVL